MPPPRAVCLCLRHLAPNGVVGAILTSLVISLVSVTASAGLAQPPLRLIVDLPLLAIAAVAYLVLAALLVGLATSLRGRAPARAAEAAA